MANNGLFALGIGHPSKNKSNETLDCFFPKPLINLSVEDSEVFDKHDLGTSEIKPEEAANLNKLSSLNLIPKTLIETDKPLALVILKHDKAIQTVEEAYLKLHLLSHRLSLPNSLNLTDLFQHLPTVVWTNRGPTDPREIDEQILHHRLNEEYLEIFSVDKFPKMTNYVIPSGVRIADASRIRLGAYLGDGTTVMHEGFVNFNAGAHGPNMVEDRISQGVVIGEGSDLGGSASTMGTLSGGGEILISIGKNCLVGANAGTGIPLGDRCTIEAGLYITSGMLISIIDENNQEVKKVKARELAGNSDMLFIRNSQTGQILCKTNRNAIALNEELHKNN